MIMLTKTRFINCSLLKFSLNCKDCWHFYCRSSKRSGGRIYLKIRWEILHSYLCQVQIIPICLSIYLFVKVILPRLKTMTWNMTNQSVEQTEPAAVINLKVPLWFVMRWNFPVKMFFRPVILGCCKQTLCLRAFRLSRLFRTSPNWPKIARESHARTEKVGLWSL